MLINFLLTDVVFEHSHYKILPIVGSVYATINYFEVKRLGKPLYSFWTWEDYTSFVIFLAMMVTFIGLWFLISSLTWKLKR